MTSPRNAPDRRGKRYRAASVAFLIATTMVLSTTGVSAGAKQIKHCIVETPAGPLDLNEFYDVSVRIVAGPCTQLGSGERWTVGVRWFTNYTFASVPDSFTPAGDTPIADFVAKFSALKYVIDPGTDEEKTYTFPNSDKLFRGTLLGFPVVNTLKLGTLQPLSVGTHAVEVFWIFTAMHCDGFGDIIGPFADGANCLVAGQHLVFEQAVNVMPDDR